MGQSGKDCSPLIAVCHPSHLPLWRRKVKSRKKPASEVRLPLEGSGLGLSLIRAQLDPDTWQGVLGVVAGPLQETHKVTTAQLKRKNFTGLRHPSMRTGG